MNSELNDLTRNALSSDPEHRLDPPAGGAL